MRRNVSSVVVALGVGAGLLAAAPAAKAAPTPAPATGSTPPNGAKVCTITDPRLDELSGMIATGSGYLVMNDGSDNPARKKIFTLDAKCNVKKEISYPTPPRDPEDLALAPDGKTVWIADIGDNKATTSETRATIALWKMPLNGSSKPVIHRLSYPNGDHHDAEALLIAGDGTPIVITKATTGKAFLYVPTGPLKANSETGVPLERVGEVTLPKGSSTPNPMGAAGRLFVTGAAQSPDRTKVVLRTLADAYEYDVSNGDVVAALTGGTPRMTPLPAEPWGEAISFTSDGASYVTVSDVGLLADGAAVEILRYAPTDWLAKNANAGGPDIVTDTDDRSWWQKMSLKQMETGIAAFGGLGALLVFVGVFGILRARRRPRVGAAADPFGPGDDPLTGYGYQDGWGPATEGGYDDGYGLHEPGSVYQSGTYQSSGVYGGGEYDSYPHRSGYPADDGYGYAGAGQGGGQAYGEGRATGAGQVYGGGQYGEPEYPYDPAGYGGYPDPDRRY